MRATADPHLAVVLDEAPQTSEACRVCLGWRLALGPPTALPDVRLP